MPALVRSQLEQSTLAISAATELLHQHQSVKVGSETSPTSFRKYEVPQGDIREFKIPVLATTCTAKEVGDVINSRYVEC